MSTRSRARALAFSLLLGAPAAAVEPPPPPAAPRSGVRAAVEVTAMDLDVVATKDGVSVNDLGKDDFVVRVDGKVVPVDYFARVDAGTVHGPDLAKASPDFVLETLRTDAGDAYVPRQFLVYFDDERLLPQERKPVIEGLRDFVTRLSPSDRASVVSYNGATHVLVPFTSSKEDLLDGLRRLEQASPRALTWESQYRQTVQELRASRASSRSGIIRSWSAESSVRDRSSLAELARSVSALAARSGKRTLLLVTNGYEWFPGQTLTQAYGPALLQQFDYDIGNDLGKVIAQANSSGITIQVFDAKGLVVGIDASQQVSPAISPYSKTQNFRDSMAALSSETGGALVESRNTFGDALERVYRESSSYYSVGVTLSGVPAADPKKSALRKVEVRTTRPGVVVRARTGFGPKSGDAAAVDRVEMALLTPGATGDFPATLRIGATEKKSGRIAPYEILVPISELTFRDEGDAKTAVIEVTLAAVQDTGARSTVRPERSKVSIPAASWEKARSEPFVYRGQVKTGKGNLRFIAGVRDVASGRMALASADVRVE